MELRQYQKDAHEALLAYLDSCPGNPLVVAPTGSGKSLLIAAFCKHFENKRILILQHVKELILQNAEKLTKLGIFPAIYSAGLGEKDFHKNVVCGGIQSLYRVEDLPRFDYCVIDEVHLLPPDGEGMYQTLLSKLKRKNPTLRVVGFTATPFRLKTGSLVENGILDEIVYNIELRRLIKDGFLSPLVSKSAVATPDLSGLHLRGGEFITKESEELYSDIALCKAVLKEIRYFARDRKSILIFCASVAHANLFTRFLRDNGEEAECIDGESEGLFREDVIKRFREQRLKFLVNVNVLTTGFDAPNTDCIVCLRPTTSPGLWVQMLGRGMRIAEGKKDCLLLDFSGNTLRHGPIDEIRLERNAVKKDGEYVLERVLKTGADKSRVCVSCRAVCSKYDASCPQCGARLPLELNHEKEAVGETPLENEPETFNVSEVFYSLHKKEGKPDSFKIQYKIGLNFSIYDYFCFDHGAWAYRQAVARWRDIAKEQSSPKTVLEALEIAKSKGLKTPSKIRVKKDGKFYRILAYSWLKEGERLEGEEDYAWEKLGINI